MISFGNFGTGKFLYEWRSHEYRNLKFSMNHERYIANSPHEWVSRRGEKQFLQERRSREWRNCFLPQLLGHEWGDLQCTLSDE